MTVRLSRSRRSKTLRASTPVLKQTRTLREVNNQNDTYFWRNTFTLPNKTTYNKIVISDVFENVPECGYGSNGSS